MPFSLTHMPHRDMKTFYIIRRACYDRGAHHHFSFKVPQFWEL